MRILTCCKNSYGCLGGCATACAERAAQNQHRSRIGPRVAPDTPNSFSRCEQLLGKCCERGRVANKTINSGALCTDNGGAQVAHLSLEIHNSWTEKRLILQFITGDGCTFCGEGRGPDCKALLSNLGTVEKCSLSLSFWLLWWLLWLWLLW